MRKLYLVMLLLILVGCTAQPDPTRQPTETFTTVRNDCGLCGTDTVIGGWEATDGRVITLSEDGNYVAFFADGTTARGEWTLVGSELCLGSACFSYQQKTDAMKLDDAIYIRE